jgi:2-polyprenyl-3-methyl-5-hydroxy-6-metoxy-1,4-benzoquinol methylase
MSEAVVYAGKDLEAMSFAVNYHRWILGEFRPFLGKHIVEVGAGTGSFSELILETDPETLSLVEPSEMYSQLVPALSQNECRTRLDFYHATFRAEAATLTEKQRPDSIIYVNVLEHIEDDEGELAAIYESLQVGGRCFLFVPALKALTGL